jgi:hypothetical protein
MSKTPYELRYDLLAMAQNILAEQNINLRIKLENDWGLERERASIRLGNGDMNVTMPPFPSIPVITEEQIIAMAEKLNKFVSNTGE